ncbi:HlyD family type I secretion periplasmic adaptor subunit [Arenibaculum sp.]|jgi:HlyD family type I secretion membrane fusion protein|uniref:HlyD family type I secretion periplasmic adaptor subunit n=1 Tax=Arenibaculum sp. TaxID=2865862 RepID=UPI002E11A6D8|nr:HlyD family type I secretion periplasmic adaptor subunit [Arenibaculum sp.]
MATLVLAVGGFGAWAALAPLRSAALAAGEVVASSHRKTVQHLEGGMVAQIRVQDGSIVAAGDVLVRLDDTRVRTEVARLEGRRDEALARAARLIAERDGAERIDFPAALTERAGEARARQAMRAQTAMFEARRALLQDREAILRQRIAQHGVQLVSIEDQEKAESRQLALIEEELAGVRQLMEKGLERKPRLLALQRTAAGIEARRAAHLGRIAELRQSVAGIELEIAELRAERLGVVTEELESVQAALGDVEERLIAARDTLRRTVVRAPQDGVVVGLQLHTVGGIIAPGEPILDLSPRRDRLVVDVRVAPEDIDVVRAGLPAQVRLTAFKQRVTPTVDGSVVLVSADRLEDATTGAPFYQARIALDPASLGTLPDANLYPGMPAEAIIVTGERTLLDYLLAPVLESMRRGLLED